MPACLTSQVQHQLPSWTQAAGRFKLFTHVANCEVLCTILSEIEAYLNSRHLCVLSDDPSNSSYLSLGNFLICDPLTQLPTINLTNVKVKFNISRSQIYQKQEKKIWPRCSSDCHQRLQQRYLELNATPNLQPGDLVLLQEDKRTHL